MSLQKAQDASPAEEVEVQTLRLVSFGVCVLLTRISDEGGKVAYYSGDTTQLFSF